MKCAWHNRLRLLGVLLTWGAAAVCPAQEDEDSLLGGNFLENEIVGRPWALRLREYVQFTDEDNDLLATDSSYARFPNAMYVSEMKLFQGDRSTYSVSYAKWQNDQGLDSSIWAWKAWLPLYTEPGELDYHLTLKARGQQWGEADTPDASSWYVGVDRSSAGGLYGYLQGRLVITDGHTAGQELYEYLSWKPTSKFRLGEQASASRLDGESEDSRPWWAGVFGTVFLIPEQTSLRLDARRYDLDDDLTFQRYVAQLYQRIGRRSLLRLSTRLYRDSRELSSEAYSFKFAHHFTARFSAHAGYRRYSHSESLSLNTFFGGIELLL